MFENSLSLIIDSTNPFCLVISWILPIQVKGQEFISLCRNAYKYVNLLHICVGHGHAKKNTNEHLINQRRKPPHQKTRKRRRTTLQQTNRIHDKFLHST